MSQEALDLPVYTVPRIVAGADFLDALPQSCSVLRDYQREHIAHAATSLHEGIRRLLMHGPTGSGKTHEISAICAAALEQGLPVLVLATRTRLISQIHERLKEFKIPHGVIASSLPHLKNFSARVQVASVDTLAARCLRGKMPLPSAAVVIFDEAHLSTAPTRLKILNAYPEAIRFGFTATPARKSGNSLSIAYDRLILGPEESWLMERGQLVPARIFNVPLASKRELAKLKKDNEGDYAKDALATLLNQGKLVGDVVGNHQRIAKGLSTIVFCINKAHGQALVEEFIQHGEPAALITDEDDETTRDDVIGKLERGELTVIVNCFLMSYGTDIPSVRCIVLARPTRSVAMYKQMVGRGCRPDEGKEFYYLIDHGRCVENLGLPHGTFEWSLDDTRNVNREARERQEKRERKEAIRTCRNCGTLWEVGNNTSTCCPTCGWKPPIAAKSVSVQQAQLGELTGQEQQKGVLDPKIIQWFQEACGVYRNRWPDRWNFKPNGGRWWAWMKTREKFKLGEAPMPSRLWETKALPPTPAVTGYVEHLEIKARYRSTQRRYG